MVLGKMNIDAQTSEATSLSLILDKNQFKLGPRPWWMAWKCENVIEKCKENTVKYKCTQEFFKMISNPSWDKN